MFDFFGWVLGNESLAEVEFVYNGSVIASCALDVQRPDVARAFGGPARVGFCKAIETVGLAADFTTDVRAVFSDGRRSEITKIRGAQELAPKLRPEHAAHHCRQPWPIWQHFVDADAL